MATSFVLLLSVIIIKVMI